MHIKLEGMLSHRNSDSADPGPGCGPSGLWSEAPGGADAASLGPPFERQSFRLIREECSAAHLWLGQDDCGSAPQNPPSVPATPQNRLGAEFLVVRYPGPTPEGQVGWHGKRLEDQDWVAIPPNPRPRVRSYD